MSDEGYNASAPTEVELDRVFFNKANAFRVEMAAADGGKVILDFQPESDGFRRIVDALTQAATQLLSSLGGTGVVITGVTETDESDDGES